MAAAPPPENPWSIHSLTPLPHTLPPAHVDESSGTTTDRQGFLQRMGGLATAAGVLGAASFAPVPSAQAIGELAEWAPDQRFAQHLVINVPDMEAALAFYIQGLQLQVLRTRLVGGMNSTFVGFGPETLTQPPDFTLGVSSFNMYGAHFALELNEVPKAAGVRPFVPSIFFFSRVWHTKHSSIHPLYRATPPSWTLGTPWPTCKWPSLPCAFPSSSSPAAPFVPPTGG